MINQVRFSAQDKDGPIQQTTLITDDHATLTIDDYTIHIELHQGEYDALKSIEASMTHQNQEIGHMSGSIISRPTTKHNFYTVGDSVTQELHELTHTFCNSHGTIGRITSNLDEDSIYSGGFCHIEKVEIDVQYKGKDLGLFFLQHVLEYLKDLWVIVVMRPEPLTKSFSERMNIDLDSEDTVMSDVERDQINTLLEEATDKICRYWARLGFQQAGHNREQFNAWYLTNTTFWNDVLDPSSGTTTWKSEGNVRELIIYKPPPPHIPQGVHKELSDLIVNKDTMNKITLHNQIKNLINERNASLHESRVLFYLAANEEYTTKKEDVDTMRLLKVLIHSTPSHVIQLDENGNAPLHVAAAALNLPVIECLLDYGAKINVKDLDGNTPLQCLLKTLQGRQDFQATFCLDLPVKPSDILKKQQCILLLMEEKDKRPLIDEWLSPRMLLALSKSAETTCFGLDNLHVEFRFEENGPTPFSTCCSRIGGIDHINYIPPDLLRAKNPNGLYKSFVMGWRMVWGAIASLLEMGQVPTKSRVEEEIHRLCRRNVRNFDMRSWSHFLRNGGKIVYALDALLVQTTNVISKGDDGWQYYDYKEEFDALLQTHFDELFDVARVKILELNDKNMRQQPEGPYYSFFNNPYDVDN